MAYLGLKLDGGAEPGGYDTEENRSFDSEKDLYTPIKVENFGNTLMTRYISYHTSPLGQKELFPKALPWVETF